MLSVNFRPWIHVWNEREYMMTELKFLFFSVPLSSTGPAVPGEVQAQLTPGRSNDLVVIWQVVRGADGYTAVSSTGQNCSSSLGTYCLISPLSCSQNHTITVTAENKAGSSEPSAPQDLLTCRFYSHTHTQTHTHTHTHTRTHTHKTTYILINKDLCNSLSSLIHFQSHVLLSWCGLKSRPQGTVPSRGLRFSGGITILPMWREMTA